MDAISIFALIILIILVATFVGVFVFLAMWPGRVAKARNHPQAEAILVGGWVTLIAGAVLWPVVLIWAYLKPPGESRAPLEQPDSDPAQLTTR